MGRKIFVSYKYGDNNVYCESILGEKTVRNYVDDLETYLKDHPEHIYKGESDGEDLSELSEETIWEKLKKRIHDTSLTIVMISPNMKTDNKIEKDQWIAQEISYSLKEHTRNGRTSKTNAVLAVVLPDKNNKYDYFIEDKTCCSNGCRSFNRSNLFQILRENMFNSKEENTKKCDNNSIIHYGDSSYISSVKWVDFIKKTETYIDKAYKIKDKKDEYNIEKKIK